MSRISRWLRGLHRRPRRLVAVVAVVLVLVGLVAWIRWPAGVPYRVSARMLPVNGVVLDTSLYVPQTGRREPSIMLAHGFGGTKDDVDSQARELAGRGYNVLTWTARGFGRSTGQIHLDAPDYEVRDARGLLDWLATQPSVQLDRPGDPRVGVVGGSYGGALALNLAGYDRRVDAIVPQITYHDLATAFLPESSGRGPLDGVFKQGWAGVFFRGTPAGLGALGEGAGGAADAAGSPQCGRYAPEICSTFLGVATTGRPTPHDVALLHEISPAAVDDRITAPTLLVQGLADTLFPLSEADANAKAIAANGTPVRVAWFSGGHDGGTGSPADQDRVKYLTAQWLDHYLKGSGPAPGTSFTYSRVTGVDPNRDGVTTTAYSVDGYPGLSAGGPTVPLRGVPQTIANPPDRTPAALSSLPGLGATGLDVSGEVPGQFAAFQSPVLDKPLDVAGAATVTVRVAVTGPVPAGGAVLFAKLYDVSPRGQATLPDGLVSPVRIPVPATSLAAAAPITVTLPAIVQRFDVGHRLRLVLATSDQAYSGPVTPTVYTVDVTGGVRVPIVTGSPIASAAVLLWWALAGLVALIVLGVATALVVARVRHRRRDQPAAPVAATPLVVRGLRKTYADGFQAVREVSFTVERGQVVGLLGPNGAGKTTTLRVLMGLTRPSGGEVFVFGHPLAAGSPVLSRLGALVEGPGFLPHLSGLANLRSFWAATGRPLGEARLDEVLEIAGLGNAIHRRVRAYSHGMKQRLAIAQAMLGLPDLLVLDEPTDGLDPPQIAEMRQVLRRYATDGRAVLVSSHLLAEVEQTCTHVVVMHLGRLVAAGPVADIVGDSPTVLLEVSDVDAAQGVLAGLGLTEVVPDGRGLVVNANGTPRASVVAALVGAGIGVERVVPRRRLEDAFLALVGEGAPDDRG